MDPPVEVSETFSPIASSKELERRSAAKETVVALRMGSVSAASRSVREYSVSRSDWAAPTLHGDRGAEQPGLAVPEREILDVLRLPLEPEGAAPGGPEDVAQRQIQDSDEHASSVGRLVVSEHAEERVGAPPSSSSISTPTRFARLPRTMRGSPTLVKSPSRRRREAIFSMRATFQVSPGRTPPMRAITPSDVLVSPNTRIDSISVRGPSPMRRSKPSRPSSVRRNPPG